MLWVNTRTLSAALFSPALVLLAPSLALAQPTEVETFTIPRPEQLVVPIYPMRQMMSGEEGMVSVSFMVDTDGKVFDPVIVDSTGDVNFHRAALLALRQSEFSPAMLDDEPIIGSSQQVYRFNLEASANGFSVTARFNSVYTRFQRAAIEGNREELEEALEDLEKVGAANHYESAFLSLARYTYAGLFGSELEQIKHIGHALSLSSSPDDPQYLEPGMVRNLRRALLPLQIRNNYFAEAVDTFAMIGGEGDLDEIVFRCEKHYVSFAIERDVAYDVPPEWGECEVQILGDKEANFLLLQS